MRSDEVEELRAEIEQRREDLVELCAALVATPSITPPGNTSAVADVARSWLARRGLRSEVHALADSQPNLVVRVDGARPGPQMIFNGHLDTMDPGDESRWAVPLFELSRRDGRLTGLGIGNMKAGVAALCVATAVILEHADRLPGTVVLTLVSDEVRFGPNGTAHLLATEPWLRDGAVISAEGPGWMSLGIAEKGVVWLDLQAEGPTGHASQAERAGPAVSRLAAAITALDALNDVHVKPPDELAGAVDADQPGTRIAVNVGILEAGESRGMMAPRARAEVDVRLPPGMALEALEARLTELLAPHGVAAKVVRGWEANWTPTDDPFVDAVRRAIVEIRGAEPVPTVRHPASDLARWRAQGTPGVCYGPQPTYAAGVDDFVYEQDVVDCAAVYALTALSGGRRIIPNGDG